MHKTGSDSNCHRVTFSGRNVTLEPSRCSGHPARLYHIAFGDHSTALAFGRPVPPILADLEDLCVATYCADHIIPGKVGPVAVSSLTRPHIHIELPVREPDLWRAPTLLLQLQRTLWEFTGLEFSFTFTKRPEEARRPSELALPLIHRADELPTVLAVDSGGLDSLLGIFITATQAPLDRLMLVSVTTNFRNALTRRQLLEGIQASLGRNRVLGRVKFSLRIGRAQREPSKYEPTARTRGFLFLGLGAVAALVAGVRALSNFENGMGAISLPYNQGQLPFDNSRSMHPRALMEMSKLIRLLTGIDFTWASPFLYWTKGEMCAAMRHSEAERLIAFSNSCDNFPQRRPVSPGQEHCGRCSSDFLRRIALEHAGMSRLEPSYQYIYDVLSPKVPSHPDWVDQYENMKLQAMRLNDIACSVDPVSRLFQEFHELEDVVTAEVALGADRGTVKQLLLDVHKRYALEVLGFEQKRAQSSTGLGR